MIDGIILQSSGGLTLEAQQFSPYQIYFAMILAVSFLTTLVYGLYKTKKSAGRTEEQIRHRGRIAEQLDTTTPVRTIIRWDDDVSAKLWELVNTNSREPPSFRDAFGRTVRAPVTAAPDIPKIANRIIGEAIIIVTLGSVLLFSAVQWRDAVNPYNDNSSGMAKEYVTEAVDMFVNFMTNFPHFDFFVKLARKLLIDLLQQMYYHPIWTGGVLLAGALAVAWMYHQSEGDIDALSLSFSPTLSFTSTVGVVWISGAAINTLVLRVTESDIVQFLLALAAFLIVLAALGKISRAILSDARTAAAAMKSAGYNRAFAYVLIKTSLVFLSILVVPVIMAYAFNAVMTGKLVEVLGTVADAPRVTHVSLLVMVLTLVAVVIYRSMEALAEAASDWKEAITANGSRLSVLSSVVAVGVSTLLFILAVGVGLSLVISFAGSILAFILIRVAYAGVRRTKYAYRHSTLAERAEGTKPTRALAEYWCVTDADGDEIHIIRLGGSHRIAHRGEDELIEAADSALETYFDGEGWKPSIESHFFRRAAQQGLVDYEGTVESCHREVQLSITGNLHYSVERADDIRDEITEVYPTETYEKVLERLVKKGRVDKLSDGKYLKLIPR